ncbi:MAG: flagellar protein FlaG [Bacteroidota bacterium]
MANTIEHITQSTASVQGPSELAPSDAQTASLKKQREQNQKVREVTQQLNKAMETTNTKLTFVVDQESKKAIVKVVDAETNRVIRQIPSEEAVLVAKKISRLMGILYDTSA